jgi:hypothetical protein
MFVNREQRKNRVAFLGQIIPLDRQPQRTTSVKKAIEKTNLGLQVTSVRGTVTPKSTHHVREYSCGLDIGS